MLHKLLIKNYAIISNINVEFNSGLSIITGETGAGKSILTGALSLLLGQRADLSILMDKNKKCIVEAEFDISKNKLRTFFISNNIDYDDTTILRREISPNGKSRAFINDTPVNLPIIKSLSEKLVDIHSQHQNLILSDNDFQISVVDKFVKNQNNLEKYKTEYSKYLQYTKELTELVSKAESIKADLDYFQFQFEQLSDINLESINKENLEIEQNELTNAEEIKTALSEAEHKLHLSDNNIISNINSTLSTIERINKYIPQAQEIYKRLNSSLIEINDILADIESINQNIEENPNKLEEINNKLDSTYSLENKHKVRTIEELIQVRNNFDNKINNINSYDENIIVAENKLRSQEEIIAVLANELHENRKNSASKLEQTIIAILSDLGIKNAKFKIKLKKIEQYNINGNTELKFYFSANKNQEIQEITKVASGGEISRIMLCLKSIVSSVSNVPTIIFDEIDTGISGDIADKMGNIFITMSKHTQILSITHLPQIASKGKYHYNVYKDDSTDKTTANIKILDSNERITEIAKMVSGKNLTNAAISNAKELLEN